MLILGYMVFARSEVRQALNMVIKLYLSMGGGLWCIS